MEPQPSTSTIELLSRVREGDRGARDQLLGQLYGDLQRLAGAQLRGERAGHTLQPTALVHEVFLKLFGDARSPQAGDRGELMATAARAMRQVLVDHARARNTRKRGGGRQREPLDDLVAWYEERDVGLVAMDEVLERLGEVDPDLARIVDLRFFAGRSNAEVAEVLGVSERTVERGWKTARAWLQVELGPDG